MAGAAHGHVRMRRVACAGSRGRARGIFGGGTLPGTVGLTFLFMAGSFSILLVKAGCVSMKPQAILGCVFASFLLGHVWSYAFSFLGPLATLVACIAITAFVLAASHPYYRPLLERIKATDAPGVLAATRPRAFLPFGHQVFIYLALFNFAHGYLLSFSSTGATTSNSLFTVAIILVVGIVLVVRKGRMFPDALFAVSVLLVTGGILLAPIAEVDGDFAALFLAAGVACFNLLYLYALLVISSKNKINTIPVLAWGASIESFFMLAGGMAGQGILQAFAADHTAVSVLSVMWCWSFWAAFFSPSGRSASTAPSPTSNRIRRCPWPRTRKHGSAAVPRLPRKPA